VARYLRHGKPYRNGEYFHVLASIAQRDDASAILYDIQQKMGGTVTTMGSNRFVNPTGLVYVRKPQRVWRAERVENIQRVLAALRTSRMPHSKLVMLKIIEEFLDIPRVRGKHTDAATLDKMRSLWKASKAAHLYQAPIS
jgi:hypothetical protein